LAIAGFLVAWAALIHKAHFAFIFFTLIFDLTKVNISTEEALRLAWYVYPYLILASIAANLVFIGAIHLAIQKIMDTKAHFRDLLSSFLYIINAISLYLFPFYTSVVAVLIYLDVVTNYRTNDLGAVIILYLFTVPIWSAVLNILAIQHVYRLSGGQSLGAWFATIVLFIPVTLVVLITQAATEAARPVRIRTLVKQLQQMRQEVIELVADKTAGDKAVSRMGDLLKLYSQESDIAQRARAQVDITAPLQHLFSLAPQPALTYLLELACHKEADLHLDASHTLKIILDAYPEHIVTTYYFLLARDLPPDLLDRLRDLPDPTPGTKLGGLFHMLLNEVNEDNVSTQLAEAEKFLVDWRDRPYGDELYLVYRALHKLSRSTTVVDLEQADIELIRILNIQNPLLTETAQVFKPLLDISQYLTYYARTEFENKVPYLAAPIMILVDEDRKLDKKRFPPEDGLLRLLIPRLQDIILREFDGLRGRADLRFELKPERMAFDQNVSIVLYVRNQGNAVAERLQVQLQANNEAGFSVNGRDTAEVNLLSPKREIRLEFQLHPVEPGRLRIPFQICYDDIEKKGRMIPFATLIQLDEPGQETTPIQRIETLVNPYITGLPVKDPAMFFGREDVFRFISDHLRGRHEKNIIVLRGQRRTGKTSILYQLAHRLDEKYVTVFFDMQGFASIGIDRFLYWLARGISQAIIERGFTLPRPTPEDFRQDPYGYFQQEFLPKALDAVGYHYLLLMFDEFEELAARVEDGKLDKDIFPYLRNLMQHTSQLDFIFAGTYKLQQITHEYWSILFNIALFKDIGSMRAEEVAQIIREPVKGIIFYDDLAIEKIARITAGHPYFVQLLGNKLVDYYLNQGKFYLTLQDVNLVLDEVLVGGALHFDYLWGQSSLTEQLLLAAMAQIISREGGVATLADISRLFDRFDLKLDQINILTAIRLLMTRDLLITDADFRQYEFKIDLVRLWLERYQRFGVVAESYRQLQLVPAG